AGDDYRAERHEHGRDDRATEPRGGGGEDHDPDDERRRDVAHVDDEVDRIASDAENLRAVEERDEGREPDDRDSPRDAIRSADDAERKPGQRECDEGPPGGPESFTKSGHE